MTHRYFKSILAFMLLFSMTLQSNPKLEIDKPDTNTLEQDSSTFYTLTIPKNVLKDTVNLVISVKGNDKPGAYNADFSDPDIYVSKFYTQPKDRYSSTWLSETYGEDIVTISQSNIEADEEFHIGVYCEYKCDYIIQATLVKSILVTEGKLYKYTIPKGNSTFIQFESKKDFDELSMSFVSPHMKPFKVFVEREDPSASNTFVLQPTWISGYSISIIKDTKEYESKGLYKIVLQASEMDVEVKLFISYPDTELAMTSTEIVFDFAAKEKKRCYAFAMQNYHNTENIIVNVMLFSGTGLIRIAGLKSISNMTYSQLPKDDDTYDLSSERVLVLTPEDIKAMSKEGNETRTLHFCVFAKSPSSFSVRVHYDNQVESLQRFNMHIVGSSVPGYLPSGQVTKYRLFEFTKDANITITLDAMEGKPVLYGYFSDKIANKMINSVVLAKEIENKNIVPAKTTFSGFEYVLLHEDNLCHKRINDSADLNKQLNQLNCSFYVVIHCTSKENCIYRLRTFHEKTFQTLIPRTSFYNILPKDSMDLYQIEITDENLTLLSIVLNTISGETSLSVKYILGDKKLTYNSENKGYLPNIVNVIPKRVKAENIKGRYEIEVKAKSFSTYSIYYYTHSKDQDANKPDWSNISVRMTKGNIIHEIFQKDVQYKIYSFQNEAAEGEESNIIITLTRRNINCAVYVFLDLSTFKYKKEDYEPINGYDWKSGYDNELIIDKKDNKYKKRGMYYIVVSKMNDYHFESPDFDGTENFYLGLTLENTDFILYEGIQHSATLKETYKGQGYWYTHRNVDDAFSLSIYSNYGSLNVYIDFKLITPDRIKNNKAELYYTKNDQESDFITIKSNDLLKKCSQRFNCAISIYLEQKGFAATQYLILAKSKDSRPEYLSPGVVVPNSILIKEKQYYIIQEYSTKNPEGSIYVSFQEGNGRVYLTYSAKSIVDLNDFPSAEKHEIEADDDYHGKLISIPKDSHDKCNPCNYLLTVVGESFNYSSSSIKYTILYSTQVKKIYPDILVNGIILQGGLEYYTFYLDDNAEYVYVSLYNMKGDAELYLKYGNDKPDFNQYNWRSINPSHDFIAINAEDPLFVSRRQRTVEGTYTIFIYSYTNTTYSLFVTSQKDKIIPINNNTPGSCICEMGNYCHFRINHFFPSYIKEIEDLTVVFTTTFNYGSGNMYAKLYNHTHHNFSTQLPNNTDYDFSNKDKNKKNFIKAEYNKTHPNLTKESMIDIAVECIEKSMLDINAAVLKNYTSQHIDIARENIFYLKKQTDPNAKKTRLYFFNYQDKDLNYEVYSYTGKGDIKVFQQYTIYGNSSNSNGTIEYNHIAQFALEPLSSYFNTIKNSAKMLHKYIYFEITPSATKDLGIYVKINYDEDLTMVKIGRVDSFIVKNSFYGYFDLLEEYSEVVLNVRCDNSKTIASVYAKINIFKEENKNKTVNQLHQFTMPDEKSNDYFGSTNQLLSSVALKISQIPKKERVGNFVRVIFKINLLVTDQEDSNSNIVNILVTPNVNYFKRIAAKPLMVYFSNHLLDKKEDMTLFDIPKQRRTDTIVRIELSSCQGELKYRLTNELTYFNSERNSPEIEYEKTTSHGRIVLTIKNSKDDVYYLSVWGQLDQTLCDEDTPNCKLVEYLMYYYSTSDEEFNTNTLSGVFTYQETKKGKLLLQLPQIKSKDLYGNKRDRNHLTFVVYFSQNVADYANMESLCYLSKMSIITEGIDYKVNLNENNIEVTGLKKYEKYYINIRINDHITGEMYTLKPINVSISNAGTGAPTWIIVLIVLGLILVTSLLLYYYRRYKLTKLRLEYEQTDVRNMAQPPKSEHELHQMSKDQKQSKYSSLTENPDSV